MLKKYNGNKVLVLVALAVLFVGFNTKIEALSLRNNKSNIKAEEDINTWMPDKNLQEEVRIDLGLGDVSQITKKGLSSLQKINMNSAGIKNLKGLEYATNLKDFEAVDNRISDLRPISDLTSLERVSLGSNQISNLNLLSGLTSLEQLYLADNRINDVRPLSGLTSLKYFILDNNQISDLSPISSLTSLKSIYLSNNKISDLSPLSKLISLKAIYSNNNRISDLSSLSKLPSLQSLYAVNQDITKDTRTIHAKKYKQHLDVKAIDGRFVDLTPVSSNGRYKGDGSIEWIKLSLGKHNLNSSWNTIIKMNDLDGKFSGKIKQNIKVTVKEKDDSNNNKNDKHLPKTGYDISIVNYLILGLLILVVSGVYIYRKDIE